MLEIIIFCSGALVMVLEMVGARVLAPHVGTSAVVWTSLIGVVLACLAVGGYLGGRLADRRLSRRTLAGLLACCAASCALTALFHQAVGEAAGRHIRSLQWAAVAAALGIFALPGLCLGMVSPYIIRLRMASLETAGATVGRLYALSTVGSIAGTFLGGFILISWWPGSVILWGVALGMGVLSLLADRTRPWKRLLLLLLLAALALWSTGRAQQGEWRLVESPYNSIRIMDGEDGSRPVRLVATDPGFHQSGMYRDAPSELYAPYTRYYALGPLVVPQARRILMLGGGGYSVPKWLLSGGAGLPAESLHCTVVELDPAMTQVARDYFALPVNDPRLRIVHADARAFLERQRERYDLVFVDVFNSCYSVPFHMGTCEAAARMRDAVAPGGALIMNVIGAAQGKDAALFQSIYKALRTAFAEVHVFGVGNPYRPETLQNLMLLAFPEARTPDWQAGEAAPSPELAALLSARMVVQPDPAIPPLRDDFAPVERYALMLLEAQRR